MQTAVKKWGNSLGNVSERKGDLVITPNKYNLSDLVSMISEKNLHSETEFGQTEGREIW